MNGSRDEEYEDPYTQEERILLKKIKKETVKWNIDNIARTKAYQRFFETCPEMKWSFLASMVSRNAGWSMNDLVTPEYHTLLSPETRRRLFNAYERANWLIFSDAYPQLLLYEASRQYEESFFHLLKAFAVSRFMQEEWSAFWQTRDFERINNCLIVNEQQLIQQPVLEQKKYERRVFKSIPFWMQDRLHFSTVLFPTVEGELYGLSVHGFRKVGKRIELGRRLLKLLFEKGLHTRFITFARSVEPIGCRSEYERFLKEGRRGHSTPLRAVYPIIPHDRGYDEDWSLKRLVRTPKFHDLSVPDNVQLNRWYANKRIQLHLLASLVDKVKN